jgi:GABA(A) receptor-associated protein
MLVKDITIQKIKKLKNKFPNKIPVIVHQKDMKIYHKFLVDDDLTVAQFMNVFRNKIKLSPTEAIYLCTLENKTMLITSTTFMTLYNDYKNKDNIVELIYMMDNVFG